MEGGSLFNPGFLGASFNWWVGQIASDSTWRDNHLAGKFESKDQIPGWARRYKVRIIGLHDREEKVISSDQLPWAQVMYPVTGGGGQANAGATANLRQGNFVFGFFLDGQDQQVPVIMGVLGSNAQTALSTKIGTDQSNFASTSGHASPADGNKDPNIKVPDEGLVVNKPKSREQSQECSPAPAGVSVNEFGLRSDLPLNKQQYKDQQSAAAEAEARGLTGTERAAFIQKAVSSGIKARCEAANSPTSPTQPGATRENVDAVHELSAADVKRNDHYLRKTVLMSPCNMTSSALKAIQIALENLTKDIDKVVNAALSYIDAVSNVIQEIKSLIANIACEIAKYMKIIFDKIMEYVLKQINKALAKTIDAMPPNKRNKFIDIKERITDLITCLYSKITNNLCGQIQGFLDRLLNLNYTPLPLTTPTTPICSVEELVGNLIQTNMDTMNKGTDDALRSVDKFLSDMQKELSNVAGAVSGIQSLVGSVSGSLTSALSFENIKLNIFGCDLTPNCPASDYYTLQNGSGGSQQKQMPSFSNVNDRAQQPVTPPTVIEKPYATPPSSLRSGRR